MALDLSKVKKKLQDHFQEGLLLVVGTGLSIAEGIPGMALLAEHLKREVPSKLTAAPDPAWDNVVRALDAGDHLEGAMEKANLLSTTVEAIVAETARLISTEERKVFERVLAGKRVLPLTPFVKHLLKAGKKFTSSRPTTTDLLRWRRKRQRSAWTPGFLAISTGCQIQRGRQTLIASRTFRVKTPFFAIRLAFASTSLTAVSTGMKSEAGSSDAQWRSARCRSSSLQGPASTRRVFGGRLTINALQVIGQPRMQLASCLSVMVSTMTIWSSTCVRT